MRLMPRDPSASILCRDMRLKAERERSRREESRAEVREKRRGRLRARERDIPYLKEKGVWVWGGRAKKG